MLKIADIAEISPGVILTRIKAEQTGTVFETITMQELSYYCNQSNTIPEKNEVLIMDEKIQNCLFTKLDDVVVGLSSGNAMVIDESRTNKLILSNFVVLRIKDLDNVDPYYLCWQLNSGLIKKRLNSLFQGTGRVLILQISSIADLEFNNIDIETQRNIGRAYNLLRLEKRLMLNKQELKESIINTSIKKKIGDIENDNSRN